MYTYTATYIVLFFNNPFFATFLLNQFLKFYFSQCIYYSLLQTVLDFFSLIYVFNFSSIVYKDLFCLFLGLFYGRSSEFILCYLRHYQTIYAVNKFWIILFYSNLIDAIVLLKCFFPNMMKPSKSLKYFRIYFLYYYLLFGFFIYD